MEFKEVKVATLTEEQWRDNEFTDLANFSRNFTEIISVHCRVRSTHVSLSLLSGGSPSNPPVFKITEHRRVRRSKDDHVFR
jgi:hypothetical protein